MSRKTATPKAPVLPSGESLLVRISFGAALLISAFLAWTSLKSGSVPGCGPESSCDRVLTSHWSKSFGIPVSIAAIAVYALLINETSRRLIRWSVVVPLAAIVISSAIWFTVLQGVVLKAFCPYCMVAHVAGTLGAVLLLRRNTLQTAQYPKALGIAVACVGVVIAGQVLVKPKAPLRVQAALPSPSTPAVPLSTNIFPVVNGQFRLDLERVPVSGPIGAKHKVAKLFDYTCHHCRDLHHLLHEYAQSNQVAVISLPMPLDNNCNPFMKKTPPDHANACEYARLGLAVYLADSKQFDPFSNWVYEPARPPSLEDTRAKAETLVGAEALRKALANPELKRMLDTDIAIYVASSRLAKTSQMPQMLFENSASIGAVANIAQLHKIMADNLLP